MLLSFCLFRWFFLKFFLYCCLCRLRSHLKNHLVVWILEEPHLRYSSLLGLWALNWTDMHGSGVKTWRATLAIQFAAWLTSLERNWCARKWCEDLKSHTCDTVRCLAYEPWMELTTYVMFEFPRMGPGLFFSFLFFLGTWAIFLVCLPSAWPVLLLLLFGHRQDSSLVGLLSFACGPGPLSPFALLAFFLFCSSWAGFLFNWSPPVLLSFSS